MRRGGLVIPGRNLAVFSDALILVRASFLDGWNERADAMGGEQIPFVAALGGRKGSRKNARLDDMPQGVLVEAHRDNRLLRTNAIVRATLEDQVMRWEDDRRRILTLQTNETQVVLRFVRSTNPDQYVVGILSRALGDKLSVLI
jgi:hypothetical protein